MLYKCKISIRKNKLLHRGMKVRIYSMDIFKGNFLCLYPNCLANCRHDNLKYHNASSSTTTNPSKLANDEELRAHRKIMIEVKLQDVFYDPG